MERVFDGYVIEVSKQILGDNFKSDNTDWCWDSEYHYFIYKADADKYFKKLKAIFSDDIPVIRMSHCMITMLGGRIVDTDVGNEICEYGTGDDGKVEVWEM